MLKSVQLVGTWLTSRVDLPSLLPNRAQPAAAACLRRLSRPCAHARIAVRCSIAVETFWSERGAMAEDQANGPAYTSVFDEVFKAELKSIFPNEQERAHRTTGLAGLALSGGGIRSAAF